MMLWYTINYMGLKSFTACSLTERLAHNDLLKPRKGTQIITQRLGEDKQIVKPARKGPSTRSYLGPVVGLD